MKKLLAMCVMAALLPCAMAADDPKADAPVLAIGDSMMRLLGVQIEKSFKAANVEPTVAFSSLGSGLVRPAAFDWTAKIAELLGEVKPKTVVVALGTNDRQPLETGEGKIIRYGEAGWEGAYALRLGGVMDQLIDGGAELIIWLLLPPMKEPVNQEHAQLVNRLASEEASKDERKDRIVLFDMGKALSKKPGQYTQFMIDPATLAALSVRDPDGVHLTAEGAKMTAKALLKTYFK